MTVGRKGDTVYECSVTGERGNRAKRLCVPETHLRVLVGAGGKDLAIAAYREAAHLACVPAPQFAEHGHRIVWKVERRFLSGMSAN